MTKTERRPIETIAREVLRDWSPKVYFGAKPYLEAMLELNTVDDMYGYDDARGILRYFLANAGTWRGEVARRVKAEIKGMI